MLKQTGISYKLWEKKNLGQTVCSEMGITVYTCACSIHVPVYVIKLDIILTFVIMCRFYGKLDFISSLLPPNEAAQIRELSFIPFNSHYIVAVLSPILFIVMIVMSVLTMVLKNKRAPYVFIIISAPVSSPILCVQIDFLCAMCSRNVSKSIISKLRLSFVTIISGNGHIHVILCYFCFCL